MYMYTIHAYIPIYKHTHILSYIHIAYVHLHKYVYTFSIDVFIHRYMRHETNKILRTNMFKANKMKYSQLMNTQ